MASYPRVPRLELELNGAQATAYIDRRLSYHAEGRADSPICAEARERIPIPASALRQGDNELRITAVDDVADENGDSQIGWDALALLRTGQAAADPARFALLLDGRSHVRAEPIAPKRKFTVYLVPHTHLDIGFTDYQPKIEELQNRNLDRLLEEMRHDADMRFSLDGVWLVEQYLRTRSPAAQKEFLEAVRAGRISIPAQYVNLMAGGASLETLIRSTYAGHALNGAAGSKNDYANITDVPAYPWSYASVLGAAGVKYFAAGANDDRGPQPLYGRWQTRSPFWWQGPDGTKVLMAYTRQYSNLWFVCGLPPHEADCRDGLPVFLQTFESPGYRPDAVLMFGSQLENTDLIPGEGEFVRRAIRSSLPGDREPRAGGREAVLAGRAPEEGMGAAARGTAAFVARSAALCRTHLHVLERLLAAGERTERASDRDQTFPRFRRPRDGALDRAGIHEPFARQHPDRAARDRGERRRHAVGTVIEVPGERARCAPDRCGDPAVQRREEDRDCQSPPEGAGER